MSKALYILGYELNVQYSRFTGAKIKTISVEAESYDEAVEIAIKRLPSETGEVTKYRHDHSIGVFKGLETYKETYRHVFKLLECLDESHKTYVPEKQDINVNNSNTNHLSSTSVAVSSLF